MLNIKNNAFIIADAHYDNTRTDFCDFLEYIKSQKPSQVILLGDIFSLLIGGIKNSIEDNKEMVKKIDDLGLETEIVYFEGNHDFNLDNIFKNVKIIKNQPIMANFYGKNIAISHGDIFLPFFTKIALKTLRFKSTIMLLNCLNLIFFNLIYKNICNQQKLKKIYKKLNNFDEIVKKRINNYKTYFLKKSLNIDYIIEGHFHQGYEKNYNNIEYINLEAFANDRSFFILEYDENIKIKKVKLPRKE